jgi:tRNA-specific 2-thiouridylase
MQNCEQPAMNRKAVALLSGGLDSSVAVKLILEQGIDVTAINFKTPFCCCNRKNGCGNEAVRMSKEFGIPVKLIYVDLEYIEMVRNPKFGYGRNMNPCLDCRIFMHKKAAEYMEEIGATFLITGEVLGQRPMSQRRDAMNLIDRESGLRGKILRPLSAGVLDPTQPEETGIVDRSLLLSVTGRGRKVQMELADRYSIKDYPCPAGGCLLTDTHFAAKLKDLFRHHEVVTMDEVRLLRTGRHLRIHPRLKIVLGRNEKENNTITALASQRFPLFLPEDFKGPSCTAIGRIDDQARKIVPRIMMHYARTNGKKTVILRNKGRDEILTGGAPLPDEDLDRFRLPA